MFDLRGDEEYADTLKRILKDLKLPPAVMVFDHLRIKRTDSFVKASTSFFFF